MANVPSLVVTGQVNPSATIYPTGMALKLYQTGQVKNFSQLWEIRSDNIAAYQIQDLQTNKITTVLENLIAFPRKIGWSMVPSNSDYLIITPGTGVTKEADGFYSATLNQASARFKFTAPTTLTNYVLSTITLTTTGFANGDYVELYIYNKAQSVTAGSSLTGTINNNTITFTNVNLSALKDFIAEGIVFQFNTSSISAMQTFTAPTVLTFTNQ